MFNAPMPSKLHYKLSPKNNAASDFKSVFFMLEEKIIKQECVSVCIGVFVCVCLCVCVFVSARAWACVCVCMCAGMYVCAL